MSSFHYHVTALSFSDGTTVRLSDDDVVLIVGGNNAGKSQALREIVKHLDHKNASDPTCVVVKAIEAVVSEDPAEIESFMSALDQLAETTPQVGRMGASMQRREIERWFQYDEATRRRELRRGLRAFTTYLVSTENRLQITNPVSAVDLRTEQKQHPFHYLQDDIALEEQISKIFRKAFGTDLVVNRTAGKRLHIQVGERPNARPSYDTSKEVREKIFALPLLSEQGDGMRAFVGSLMWGIVVEYQIILIDEPEAFLHPPQARLLGRTLIEKRPENTQLFLATHSGDILRGALDANVSRLRILRLVRESDVNRVTELAPRDVAALASDSLLRQTNVLDALFHRQTIVCESDSDCQFYSEMTRVLADADEGRASPDVLFLQSYGKSRLAAVVAPLRMLGVPVKVIADFDVLREEEPLRSIVVALGGDWSSVKADWKAVQSAVSGKKAQLDKADLEKAIHNALAKVEGTVVPDSALKEIKDAARKASAWADAKTVGEAFLSAGDVTNRYQRLTANLRGLDLYVVPKGELESFCKSVDGHGPRWVEQVSKRDFARDPELRDAREFTQRVVWGTMHPTN